MKVQLLGSLLLNGRPRLSPQLLPLACFSSVVVGMWGVNQQKEKLVSRAPLHTVLKVVPSQCPQVAGTAPPPEPWLQVQRPLQCWSFLGQLLPIYSLKVVVSSNSSTGPFRLWELAANCCATAGGGSNSTTPQEGRPLTALRGLSFDKT